MDRCGHDDELQARLDDAFGEYLSLVDAGNSADLDDLFDRYADCADQLKAYIEADGYMQVAFELAKSRSSSAASANDVSAISASALSHLEKRNRANEGPIDSNERPSRFVTGRILGDYELLEEVGRGGMGIVYRARQCSLDRIVAVKVIAEGELATPIARKRFRSEAQSAAKLQHPNIVAIHDIGEEQGLSYFSMDYISSQSLATVLREGPLRPRRAAQLLSAIAMAVNFAHEHGLLHRDLKPSNVLLDDSCQPLVADFGLSRSVDDASKLTMTGEIVGTVSYMSPEQSVSSRDLGPATDIYSLGALLYSLLVGSPPYQSDNPVDTLLQLREREPVPPRQLNPRIPPELETICLKCLEKTPVRRYPSALDLAEDLERFLAGKPIVAQPATWITRTWRWCARHRAKGAAVGIGLFSTAAILVGSLVYSIHVSDLNSRLTKANGDLINARGSLLNSQQFLQTALHDARTAHEQAVAHEQRLEQLFYAADMRSTSRALSEGDFREVVRILEQHVPTSGERDRRGLEWYLLKNLTSSPHTVLTGHQDNVNIVRYSADGRWLASGSDDGTVRLYRARTLALQRVIRPGRGPVFGIGFSNTGEILACCNDDGSVMLVDTQTGETLRTIDAHPTRAADVIWTPDGKLLITSGDDKFVRMWDTETGQTRGEIGPHKSDKTVRRMSLSPDGRLLATCCEWEVTLWDLKLRKSVGKYFNSRRTTSVAFSSDGQWLSVGSLTSRATMLSIPGFQESASASIHKDAVEAVAFSPDGRWGVDVDRGGMIALWPTGNLGSDAALTGTAPPDTVPLDTVLPDGVVLRPVRWWGHSDRILSVAFSPDSGQLATGGRDSIVNVWPMETVHQPRRLGVGQQGPIEAAGFLDNRSLVTLTENDIFEWDLTTGDSRLIHSIDYASALAVLPSRNLVAVGTSNGEAYLWKRGASENAKRINNSDLGFVDELMFSADGSRLFVQGLNGLKVFDVASLATLRLVPEIRCNAMAVSPDGRLLALSRYGLDNIELWDLGTSERLQMMKGHSSAINSLAFSPGGSMIASASEDRLVKLWDVTSGQLQFELSGHRRRVRSVMFSPDGRSLWSTGWDGTLRSWSVALGRELLTIGQLNPSTVGAFQVALSPDGRQLIHIVGGQTYIYSVAVETP